MVFKLNNIVLWLSVVIIFEHHTAMLLKTGKESLNGRIVGGGETSIFSHPYTASIQYFGFHYCGAAIISDKFLVTAAHCASG